MDEKVRSILAQLRRSPEFDEDADFSNVNVCAIDGDNALHWASRSGDSVAAKALIAAGINVNKAGDLGYTPLHVACMQGDLEMIKLLLANGADLFARSEGDVPFTSARRGGHDQVCDFLGPLMKRAQSQDPHIWMRTRIEELQREIAYLERRINSKE
jgi:ankyrin repeat protein